MNIINRDEKIARGYAFILRKYMNQEQVMELYKGKYWEVVFVKWSQ